MCDELSSIIINKTIPPIKNTASIDGHTDVGENVDVIELGRTVCYIVAAVLINDNNEVLLIQEAKVSCYGQWYLPAGRVEPDETLTDAVKREVLEEAGCNFEPTGLICIEENGAGWIRFTFGGKITGGSLKTQDKSDKESLQAKWFADYESEKLRARDILRLITQAKTYYRCLKEDNSERSTTLLPKIISHKSIVVRSVILSELNQLLHILSIKESCHEDSDQWKTLLPTTYFSLFDIRIEDSILRTLGRCLSDVNAWQPTIVGILDVEHKGNSSENQDGIGFTVLVVLADKHIAQGTQLPKLNQDLAKWEELDRTLQDTFIAGHRERNIVPLLSLGRR
ncbi:8-oxo-dGDP phosphatase NUDT18-like [Clavelina lepadiformis]|uniref:8-oxo-dGDP phosphatase NUDT18-like n=1 Tax=Clavelina lepadiformis TaxID=159417 RepID=UPI0040434541